MKNPVFIQAMLLLFLNSAQAQSFNEKIDKTYSFEKKGNQNAILIFNINGNVTIEGTAGDRVQVEVEKSIQGKTDARLAMGKEKIQLGVMDLADTLIFYVKGTGAEFARNTKKKGSEAGGWGYQWDRKWDGDDKEEDDRDEFEYKMNFKIKIPQNIHVMASTINEGDVTVSGTRGIVQARNVNGHIRIKDITGGTQAHTINGNVDIDYHTNPKQDCRYYTLNGDIHVNFPGTVSGTMSFKSFNGDLYTNIEPLTPMPAVVTKKETGKGIKYQVENERYRIRGDGPKFDVETFNGDAYLKEMINK